MNFEQRTNFLFRSSNTCFLWMSVSACIKSASPSTSLRSNLPAQNARLVNSPGSDGRNPSTELIASHIAEITATPPCTWNSQQSSPVKLFGPGNHSTSPSSIKSCVVGCRSLRNVAILGFTLKLVDSPWDVIRLITSLVCGPDTRITATPLFPRPKIYVGFVTGTYL